MSDAREPNNAAAEAHRQIAELRAVNSGLRSSPYNPAPDLGPLSEDEYIRQFALDTGWVIDTNGNKIGEVPGWVPPGTPGREADGTRGMHVTMPPIGRPPEQLQEYTTAREQRGELKQLETPMFGRKKPFVPGTRITLDQIAGVDLVNGEVIVDGYRFPITPEEQMNIARFCADAMIRDLAAQIAALKEDNGFPDPPPENKEPNGDGEVPEVQATPTDGAVPRAPRKGGKKAGVVPKMHEGASAAHGGGGGDAAPVASRDGEVGVD